MSDGTAAERPRRDSRKSGSDRIAPREPTLLCVDVGLTHVKTVLFRPDGTIVARASRAYPTYRPTATTAEQDPRDWWAAVASGLVALREGHGEALDSAVGIGITGHMHALVCLDIDLEPIGRAIVLGDRRATRDASAITSELGAEEIHRLTGATLDASMPAAEIHWLRSHDPGRWRRTSLIAGVKDALRIKLTGVALTDPIDACATALYDIRRGQWSADLLRTVGIEAERLPTVVSPSDTAGALKPVPARELGLRAGIPVVVGAGDDIEVLGANLTDPGDALEHLGTTGSIFAVATQPIDQTDLTLELYPHAIPGLWVVGGSMTAAGASIAWATSLLGFESPFAALAVLEMQPPPFGDGPSTTTDDLLFLPGLAGERCPVRDPAARGAWLGFGLSSDRQAMTAAAFEGVAFALRRILEAVEERIGHQRRVIISGGVIDVDPRWAGLRRVIYGRPLLPIASPEPTALGLLAVVLAGVGLAPDLRTAARQVARLGRYVAPGPQDHMALERRYRSWLVGTGASRSVWQANGQ